MFLRSFRTHFEEDLAAGRGKGTACLHNPPLGPVCGQGSKVSPSTGGERHSAPAAVKEQCAKYIISRRTLSNRRRFACLGVWVFGSSKFFFPEFQLPMIRANPWTKAVADTPCPRGCLRRRTRPESPEFHAVVYFRSCGVQMSLPCRSSHVMTSSQCVRSFGRSSKLFVPKENFAPICLARRRNFGLG